MRISEILKGLTALQLNEADEPRQKKSTDTSKTGKAKEAAEVKTNSANKALATNDKAKRNPTKVQGRDKGAHSKDEKIAQQAGEVKDLASDGKGKGQEGGQAIRAANQAKKSGAAEKGITQHKEKQGQLGAMNPLGGYGREDNGSDAADASDDYFDSIGTEDENYNDFKLPNDMRPGFSADTKDNQGHGLDDPDSINFDYDGDGDLDQDDVDMNQDEWDASPKKSKQPHDPQMINALLAHADPDNVAIGQAMQRANDAWNDAQARTKENRHKTTDAERQLAAQKAAKKAQQDAAYNAISPETRTAIEKKKALNAKNTQTYQDLPRIEKEVGKQTGAKRGSAEVTHNAAKVNAAGGRMSAEDMNAAAARAAQGDKEAQGELFKNTGRMLFMLAKKYSMSNQDKLADLYGEAKAALMQAIKTYDPAQGKQFSTWLYSNVENLVKTASYEDRNVRIPQKQSDKVTAYRFLKGKLQAQGITGVDADLEIIGKLGLKSWDELDQIKQTAQMSSTASMSTPVGGTEDGDAGELGDTLGGQGIESEYGSQADAIGSKDTGSDLETMSKELATADEETKAEIMGRMAEGAGLRPDEQTLVSLAFGIGGQKPMTDKEIRDQTGWARSKIDSTTEEALYRLAAFISEQTGERMEVELANLERIYKNREFEYTAAKAGRESDDYVDDESMKDTPEEKKARGNVKTQRKVKQDKEKAQKASSRNSAMADAMNSAKEKAAKKEPVTESERMRNFLDLMN